MTTTGYKQSIVTRLTLWRNLVIVILVLLSITLSSCGGGSGGDESTDENTGWVTVSPSDVTVDSDSTAIAILHGEAFVAANTCVAHTCIGLECVFGRYDDSYPGVDITWLNLTTGITGMATSRYGTATSREHLWAASVPLVLGVNEIQVTASDLAGNTGTASISVTYQPPAPSDLRANTGDAEITLSWSSVPEATSYRLYWSLTPDDVFSIGTQIDLESTSYVHRGLNNGTTYYYAVTSRYISSESPPSAVVSATAGVPSRPTDLSANLISLDIELCWDITPLADTYTLYWDNNPGVTKQIGIPIVAANNPHLHTGLSGIPYYYVITASNGYGESIISDEVMAYPPLPPQAPTDVSADQRFIDDQTIVDLFWQSIPGVDTYNIYRSWLGYASLPDPENCTGLPWHNADPWELVGTNTEANFVDWTVNNGYGNMLAVYRYYMTATNTFGTGPPSDWIPVCISAE